jgi:hypothetical protein
MIRYWILVSVPKNEEFMSSVPSGLAPSAPALHNHRIPSGALFKNPFGIQYRPVIMEINRVIK